MWRALKKAATVVIFRQYSDPKKRAATRRKEVSIYFQEEKTGIYFSGTRVANF
jgi:hypothetical protein